MAKLYIENLLGENERILYSTRQHWFVLVSSIALEIMLILIIFALTITAAVMPWSEGWGWLVGIVGALVMLIPIATMTRDVLIWSHHQYFVTNWRVIQVSGIINKNVLDSSLEKVNDVKMTQSFFGRIFGFGDIEILTGSELGANLFRRIEEPVRFKTAMINAKESVARRASQPLNNLPPAMDIPAVIAQLGDLRQKNILTEEEFQKMKSEVLAKLK